MRVVSSEGGRSSRRNQRPSRTMEKPSRTKANASRLSRNMNKQDQVVPIPAGVIFESQEEERIWRQFASARDVSFWRSLDLILLARAARLEVKLREVEAMAADQSVTIVGPRGGVSVNPIFDLYRSLQTQQIGILKAARAIYGMSGGTDQQMVNEAGDSGLTAQEQAERESDNPNDFKNSPASLLAS